MTDFTDWPDAERVVADLLSPLGTVGTETPQALQSSLPYFRVGRTGGSDNGVTDSAFIAVAAFAGSADDAKRAAGQARQTLVRKPSEGGPEKSTAHGRLDSITTASGPLMTPPTDSDNLRLCAATYQVTMRKAST